MALHEVDADVATLGLLGYPIQTRTRTWTGCVYDHLPTQ